MKIYSLFLIMCCLGLSSCASAPNNHNPNYYTANTAQMTGYEQPTASAKAALIANKMISY